MMLKTIISLCAIGISFGLVGAIAGEIITTTDGRTVKLNDDKSFEILKSGKYLELSLIGTGRPTKMDFMSRPDDCRLTFKIRNFTGGTLYNFYARIQILDAQNSELETSGFSSIDPFGFKDDLVVANGGELTESIVVKAKCDQIARIIIQEVPRKACNFSNSPSDFDCRKSLKVNSEVASIDIAK